MEHTTAQARAHRPLVLFTIRRLSCFYLLVPMSMPKTLTVIRPCYELQKPAILPWWRHLQKLQTLI